MNTDRIARPRGRWPVAWAGAVLTSTIMGGGCSAQPDDGLNKFPVTGSVLVDGEPAEGVVVRFFRDGRPGETNADTPIAVTDESGAFALSTNGDRDGAVPGTYRVTFTWKTNNSPGASDRLHGQYTKLETSMTEAVVREEKTDLPPFELKGYSEAAAAKSDKPARRNPSLPPVKRN